MKTTKKKGKQMTATDLRSKVKFFRKLRWAAAISIAFISLALGVFLISHAWKTNHRTAHGVCIEKMECIDSRNGDVQLGCILICKEDNGAVFDVQVKPAAYVMTNKGDRVEFKGISLDELGESDSKTNAGMIGWMLIAVFIIALICMLKCWEWLQADDIELNNYSALSWEERQIWKGMKLNQL